MSPRVKGIVIGGVIGGLLSVIPFLNLGNCLCCLWLILGAAVAAAFHVKGSAEPVTKGAGTITGLLSGGPMALTFIVIGLPINLLFGPVLQTALMGMSPDPMVQEQLAMQATASTMGTIINHIISSVIFLFLAAGFGALGGLIGTAIFEKREPLPPGMSGGPGAPMGGGPGAPMGGGPGAPMGGGPGAPMGGGPGAPMGGGPGGPPPQGGPGAPGY